MSIDKTLRLTVESGSEITSFLDCVPRLTISQFPDTSMTQPKLCSSHSLKNLRLESSRFTELEYQNQMLKIQISTLKKQLKVEREGRNNEVAQLEEEIFKLKKLIQKSYYSLKGLENQNIKIKGESNQIRSANLEVSERVKYLQQKGKEMCEYITEIKQNHEKQVTLIWERVAHLQKNMEAIVRLIEQERAQQKFYKNLRTSISESSSEKSLRIKYY